jgi:hypothetical protein
MSRIGKRAESEESRVGRHDTPNIELRGRRLSPAHMAAIRGSKPRVAWMGPLSRDGPSRPRQPRRRGQLKVSSGLCLPHVSYIGAREYNQMPFVIAYIISNLINDAGR